MATRGVVVLPLRLQSVLLQLRLLLQGRGQQQLQWPSDHDGRVLKPAELGATSSGRLMCQQPCGRS